MARRFLSFRLLSSAFCLVSFAAAQEWKPSRNIEIVVSSALGNQNHIVLGMLAKAAGVDPKALKIVVYSSGGQGVDAAYFAFRGFLGPGALTPAQRAFWDQSFAKIVHSAEWKRTEEEHAWGSGFLASAGTRKHLDAEYEALRKILAELGVTKQRRPPSLPAEHDPGAPLREGVRLVPPATLF